MSPVVAWSALALAAGAAAGVLTTLPPPVAAVLLVTATVSAGVAWWRGPRTPAVVLLVLGFGTAGLALGAHDREAALRPSVRTVLYGAMGGVAISSAGPVPEHAPLLLRGVVIEDATVRDGFVQLDVRATALRIGDVWTPVSGGLRLAVAGADAPRRAAGWTTGRRLELPVTVRRPARVFNEGSGDAERALLLRGTALAGSVKSGLLVRVVGSGSRFDEAAAALRRHVRRAMTRWVGVHGAVPAAVATAVLIGDRGALPPDVTMRLQHAGTYHVIAISGGNVAMLTTAWLAALAACGIRGRRSAFAALVGLGGYLGVVVDGPSVWRATLMAAVVLSARALDLRTTSWQALAVTAGALAAAWPLGVLDAGLLLTCGATAALVTVARAPRAAGLRGWLEAGARASLAVELALLPVAATIFSRLTVAGLVLNPVALPLMALVQIAGLAVACTDPVPWIARPCAWLVQAAVDGLLGSTALLEVAPWTTWRVPPPAPSLVALYYAGLIGWVWSRRGGVEGEPPVETGTPGECRSSVGERVARVSRRAPWLAVGVAVAAGLAIATGRPASGPVRPRPPMALRWTLIDVGQGEAMLLEFPDGRRLLVDAGGQPSDDAAAGIGARVTSPALWARGVRSLDAVLVTHGDLDHAGGMAAVIDDFRPRWLWQGIDVPSHPVSRRLSDAARRTATPYRRLRAGLSWAWGGVTVRALHPPEPDWQRTRVRNDDSVVLAVQYGDVALLLTGDAGEAVERAVLPQLPSAPIRLLKAGHHGSATATSAALLDGWRPTAVFVSAGRGNRFGHPSPVVTRRLRGRGMTVWRTDRHGQITVDIEPHAVRVRTWTPPDGG